MSKNKKMTKAEKDKLTVRILCISLAALMALGGLATIITVLVQMF